MHKEGFRFSAKWKTGAAFLWVEGKKFLFWRIHFSVSGAEITAGALRLRNDSSNLPKANQAAPHPSFLPSAKNPPSPEGEG